MSNGQTDVRTMLLEALLDKIEQETYPSSTMLDVVESLLTQQETERYVDVLVNLIRDSQFPSTSMIQRVQALT
jgi:hypothetical protein